MEGIQNSKKKIGEFWQYIRKQVIQLKEWIAQIFKDFYRRAKKEKKKIADKQYKRTPKDIINS